MWICAHIHTHTHTHAHAHTLWSKSRLCWQVHLCLVEDEKKLWPFQQRDPFLPLPSYSSVLHICHTITHTVYLSGVLFDYTLKSSLHSRHLICCSCCFWSKTMALHCVCRGVWPARGSEDRTSFSKANAKWQCHVESSALVKEYRHRLEENGEV